MKMNFLKLNSRSGLNPNTLAIPILLFVFLTFGAKNFASFENLTNLSGQIAALVIVSLGQMVVAISAGLDLSVGSVISLTTCIIATGGPLVLTLPLSMLLGAAVGFVNGWGVAVLGIHPIVMTLSTMTFVQGATYVWQTFPGGKVPAGLSAVAVGNFLGVPFPLIWIVICVALVAILLNKTRFGPHLFAVGNNTASARLNGVATYRVAVSAYVICSLLAVVAGVYLTARIASGDPNIGVSFGLDSITAIALGGTQLSGGIGGPASTVLGALSLGLISNGMNLIGVSPFLQSAAKGLLLIIAICAQRRKTVGL
jgi:ribose transport system permease protein